MKMTTEIEIIGTIHSPFKELENMPIQPPGAKGISGEVVVFDQYADGLSDLDGFTHIYLLYHFHMAPRTELMVVPFLESKKRGVFATRSPLRPSHIGISIVELISVNNNRLKVQGIDILDGTPLLDIKPYVPRFDHRPDATSGWLASVDGDFKNARSDNRFV